MVTIPGIDEFNKQWKAISNWYPNYMQVASALENIQRSGKCSLLPTMSIEWKGGIPTFDDLLDDIKAGGKNTWIRDSLMNEDYCSSHKIRHFLLSVDTFRNPGKSPFSMAVKPLSAWCVPATEEGMGKFDLTFSELQEPYLPVRIGTRTAFDATTTPPGNVSDLHIDHTGLSVYITAVSGCKLVLVYPPTRQNLSIFEPFHVKSNPVLLWSALSDQSGLEGLQIVVLREGKGIRLQPGAIHCLVSAGWASVGGYAVAEYSALDMAASAMRWEFEALKRREEEHGKGTPNSAKEMKRVLKDDYELWLQLAQELGGGEERGY